MKKLVPLLLLGFTSLQLVAQAPVTQPAQRPGGSAPVSQTPIPGATATKGNGKVSGTVVDAATNKPVEFATVALIKLSTNKSADGAICDDKGRFTISKVESGEYKVVVTFIGYEGKTIDNVVLANNNSEVNLGTIAIGSDAKALKEVTIEGQRDIVEQKIDRIVYNAEKDLTNAGGNAGDVLKKVPMVSVDLEGNVQLRGSSNIKVLINNKPSTIMASNVADALKQIPADIIKSVEVITSPSAKYEAEGSAGIINIITKKNNLQGLSGGVNISPSNRYSFAGGNANYRKGKFGLSANLGSNIFWTRSDFDNYSENYFKTFRNDELIRTDTATTQQSSVNNNHGKFLFGQLGLDYDINKTNVLAGSVRFSGGQFRTDSDLNNYSYSPTNNAAFNRDIDNVNKNQGVDINLDYTRTFTTPQKELSFLTQYSHNNRDNDYAFDQRNLLTDVNTVSYREQAFNQSVNKEFTSQVDYVHPFKNKTTLEIGAKGILRNVSSDYRAQTANASDAPFVIDDSRTNIFNYDQNVGASYVTYGFTVKKFGFKLGSRYEHTFIDADFSTGGSKFTTDYSNLIPSGVISYDLKQNQKVKLSYNQRIQRPQIFYLNPYRNETNPQSITYGNPTLDPELTHNLELNYNLFFKNGTSVNMALYGRRTNNAIESVRFIEDNPTNPGDSIIVYTTFQNIAKNSTGGLSLFGSTKILPKWSVSGNANIYYTRLNGLFSPQGESQAQAISNSGVMYNFNLNSSWLFDKGWSAQFFGFLNSPRVQLQGTNSAFSIYNFAVKKELFKKKGGISLGVDYPFAKTNNMRNKLESPDFYSNGNTRFYVRSIRMSFNYQFGKMDFNAQPRRKKRISNDDQKQGGDGNGQGGQ